MISDDWVSRSIYERLWMDLCQPELPTPMSSATQPVEPSEKAPVGATEIAQPTLGESSKSAPAGSPSSAQQCNGSYSESEYISRTPSQARQAADPFQNIPLPIIAEEEHSHLMDTRTPFVCCRSATCFNEGYGLPVGKGMVAAASSQEELKNSNEFVLELIDVLYLVANLAQEASLGSFFQLRFP